MDYRERACKATEEAIRSAVFAEREAIVDAIAGIRDKYRQNSGDWLTGFEDGCNEAMAIIVGRNSRGDQR